MSKKMPHSKWITPNYNLLTTQFGRLTPFFFQPIVPGDRLSMKSQFTLQLQPLLSPAFQDCRMYVHYYYVPSRVLYLQPAYDAFISREQRQLFQQPVPRTKSVCYIADLVESVNSVYRNNSTGSVVPCVNDSHCFDGLLPDYLRIQLADGILDFSKSQEQIILEPFVAMFKIYIDHYASTLYPNYFVDYTSSNGGYNYLALSYEDLLYIYSFLQNIGFDHSLSVSTSITVPSSLVVNPLRLLVQVPHVMYGRKGDIFMEAYPTAETVPSQSIGTTIESFRLANAIQQYKERKARVGHGLSDFLWEFFKVRNSDARLQKSSFLGGGRLQVNIDDVPQTSETSQSSALGELAGNAWKKGAFNFGRRYFEEYGFVFGLFYLVPKQSYFNGLDHLWKMKNSDDLYLEAFDSIGDEPVFKGELVCDSSSANNQAVIGYQPRYQRYKRAKDEIHGDFRNSLMYWHQSRSFNVNTSLASIRPCFATSQGLNRIFNYNGFPTAASEQPIMVYIKNTARWRRKMRYKQLPHL